MSSTKEAMLIALLKETQDADVANTLFEPYYAILRAFLFKQGATEFEIDDLIQDAIFSAYNKIGGFRGNSSFKTWITKIAFTKFIDNQRKKKRLIKLLEKLFVEQVPDEDLGAKYDYEHYEALLAILSIEQRKVFLCCEWIGYSHSEASKLLEMPLGTVKTHMSQSKKLLASHLGNNNAD